VDQMVVEEVAGPALGLINVSTDCALARPVALENNAVRMAVGALVVLAPPDRAATLLVFVLPSAGMVSVILPLKM